MFLWFKKRANQKISNSLATKQQKQVITYKSITIYQQINELPILKNTGFKTVQKKIRERVILIKEGVRYHHFCGVIKWQEKVTQEDIFKELQLLITDYSDLINLLENYKHKYQLFLYKLTKNLKTMFNEKYLEIKNVDEERKILQLKYHQNPQIIDELKWETQENLKANLLLSNAYVLMLEKIQVLHEGINHLAEDTKNQKQTILHILKELEVYQEIYEYQIKARNIRQEVEKIVETAINYENCLQNYLTPFQSFIDEIVKLDENFYSTVEEVKNLADNILTSGSNLLSPESSKETSERFINFMVSSYEKKERLNDALIQSQFLNLQLYDFELTENSVSLDNRIESISNYLSKQLAQQTKLLEIGEENVVSTTPLFSVEETGFTELKSEDVRFTNKFKSNQKIDYAQLRDFLAQHKWKQADIETTKLMLQVMGKNYWNEVYKEDIHNFCCQALHTIDQLWGQYSYGYFGFSAQQSIWEEVGGQVDYEAQKRLGDCLGWRKEGNWLDYEQLNFELSPTTPPGHLPVNWLHYSGTNLSSESSAKNPSMGAWRVDSWLVWQMHLFLSRTKICHELRTKVSGEWH